MAKRVSPARTYLVQGSSGEFKIDVPEGGSVTFGPAIPGPRDGRFQTQMEYALRVYGPGGKTDMIAVFTGIREFRDAALPHAKAIIKEAGKVLWKSDETGYEVSKTASREKKWTALEEAKLTGDDYA